MNSINQKPGIGAAILIWKSDKRDLLLVGQGHNKKEENIYALAGGHLEPGETLAQAAIREAREESGVVIKDVKLLTVYEFFNKERQKQYVTVAFEGIWDGAEPTPEKEKRVSWDWYSLDDAIKLPLFESDHVLLNNVRTGILYDVDINRKVYGYE